MKTFPPYLLFQKVSRAAKVPIAKEMTGVPSGE